MAGGILLMTVYRPGLVTGSNADTGFEPMVGRHPIGAMLNWVIVVVLEVRIMQPSVAGRFAGWTLPVCADDPVTG